MKIAKCGALLLIPILLVSAFVAGQSSTAIPTITNLFTPEETRKAGLSKLDPNEISALNAAIFRVLVEMDTKSESRSGIKTPGATDTDDLDFIFMTPEDGRLRMLQQIAT